MQHFKNVIVSFEEQKDINLTCVTPVHLLASLQAELIEANVVKSPLSHTTHLTDTSPHRPVMKDGL